MPIHHPPTKKKKINGTQSTLWNLAMIQYNTPLLVFIYVVHPTQIKQTLLTKPNKCLVAIFPSFLIFYNKNAKVLCNQCSILKCIVHGALLELMRFSSPINLIFFFLLIISFFFRILSFTFGFRCLVSCANIEFFILFYLFLEESFGCHRDLYIWRFE